MIIIRKNTFYSGCIDTKLLFKKETKSHATCQLKQANTPSNRHTCLQI